MGQHSDIISSDAASDPIETSLESKFGLKPFHVQDIIEAANTPLLYRTDLSKFLLDNYRSWHKRGIWNSYDLPSFSSEALQRVEHLLSMAIHNEVRGLIILHLFLEDFNSLQHTLFSLSKRQRRYTAAIDMIVQRRKHTREEVQCYLKLSRRLKRITDKLGLAMILIAGTHLWTLLRGKMTNDMLDCLAFYITKKLPCVLRMAEILDGTATNLVHNVPLPPLEEEFSAQLAEVEKALRQALTTRASTPTDRASKTDLPAHMLPTPSRSGTREDAGATTAASSPQTPALDGFDG